MRPKPQHAVAPSVSPLSRPLREAMRLQEIEHNPLDPEQVAMFAMFERQGWSERQRLDYLRKRRLERSAALTVAE